MAKDRLLIYGATGYMGQLIAERAKELRPVLAGRDPKKLARLAERLDLPFRAFALETPAEREQRLRRPPPRPSRPQGAAIDAALVDVSAVLNVAGPFGETAMPLARACVRTGTHYLDISGEFAVLNELDDLGDVARRKGVVVMPGIGLTVLGSELLVAAASRSLRDQTFRPHLARVALSRVDFVSRGSAKTMLDAVRNGALVRRNDRLEVVPVGQRVRSFTFSSDTDPGEDDERVCTAMTLADAYTVGRSAARLWRRSLSPGESGQPPRTIPNVEAYVEASGLEQLGYELGASLSLALRGQPLKGLLNRMLDIWPEGPPKREREESRQQVIVELEDRYRRTIRQRLRLANSYDFTVEAAHWFLNYAHGGVALGGGFRSPGEVFDDLDDDAFSRTFAALCGRPKPDPLLHGFRAQSSA